MAYDATTPHFTDTDDRCFACQVDEAVAERTATDRERTVWMMQGCTCAPEDAAAVNRMYREND